MREAKSGGAGGDGDGDEDEDGGGSDGGRPVSNPGPRRIMDCLNMALSPPRYGRCPRFSAASSWTAAPINDRWLNA